MDLHTQEVFYGKLIFVYLEMPKFNKQENELVTMFDKWLFVLRNLATLLERPAALQERVFTRLFEAAEIAKFTKRELCEYEDSLKNFQDNSQDITIEGLFQYDMGQPFYGYFTASLKLSLAASRILAACSSVRLLL